MDPIGAFTVLAVGVGVGWAAIVAGKRYQAKVDAAWLQAAQQLGGSLVPPSGPWYKKTSRAIQAVVRGVPVTIDTYVVSTGKSSTTYTRFRAHAPLAAAVGLKVVPHGFLAGLAVGLGAQDIEVGDPAFDQQWVVKGSQPGLVRQMLDGEARQAMLALREGVVSEGQDLRHNRRGLVAEPGQLMLVAQALAEVAGWPLRLLERWRHAAGALGLEVKAEGTVPTLVGRLHDRDVTIAAHLADEGSLRLTVGLRQISQAPLVADDTTVLPPQARAAFAASGARRVARRPQAVEVLLPGLVPDVARITQAVVLAEALADDHGAAYR